MSDKPLTMRMRAFAELYTGVGSGKDAAIAAGVKPSNAVVSASKMLRDPRIIAIIDARISKKAHAASLSRTELQIWWSKTIRDDGEEMPARQKASELLARSLGMFINRVQLSAEISHKLPEGLTAEEVRSLARGVTPETKALPPPHVELQQDEDDDDEPGNNAPH